MSIESTHPDYSTMLDDWRQMRDTVAGQRVVKEAGTAYLPATMGMLLDGVAEASQPGYGQYLSYRDRAVFPEIVDEAVSVMVGIMHREPADIQLPAVMEPLRNSATRMGEGLQMLLRRINESQLLYGRIGTLIDVEDGADLPHIVTYGAETITNWDDTRAVETDVNKLSFLVTSEDAYVRGGEGATQFDWVLSTRYRVAEVGDSGYYETYVQHDDETGPVITPNVGGKPLDFIPFTFIGSRDLTPTPDRIPLLPISNIALSIYKSEADYRQSLHMLSQDTLVIKGAQLGDDNDPDAPTRIGAGAKIEVPEEGDAKFIGIESKGVPEQRKAIEDDRKTAAAQGARLLENTSSQAESGEALRVRVAAKTTTLQTVALAGGVGLETALKQIAIWIGANPDEVRVTPNTDFVEDNGSAEDAAKLVEAKLQGLPISLESLHEWMRKNDLTTKTWDEEIATIKTEAPIMAMFKTTLGELLPDPPPVVVNEPGAEDEDENKPNPGDESEGDE